MKSVEYVTARARTNMERPLSRQAPIAASAASPRVLELRSAGPFHEFLVDATGDFTSSASAYSARRAVAGSTRAARLAGRQHAASATPMTRKAAPASASGS